MKKFYLNNKTKHWFSVALFIGIISNACAQSSCFELRLSTENASVGDTVRLRLTTRGFTEITGYQFTLDWSPADLQFIRLDLSSSSLTNQLFNSVLASTGKLPTLWSDVNASGVTLPDDAVLFEMDFKVLATDAGFYPVKINPDISPTLYEMTGNNGNLPLAHPIGGVSTGPPSDFAIASFCVTMPPCNASLGRIDVFVVGGTLPYQYQWKGPNGFSSDANILTNLAPGYYNLTVTDAAGAATHAAALLHTTATNIHFGTINTTNAICSQPNGCIDLTVNGGTAPYSYQWSLPGATTEDRCDLLPGYHSVTVTDAAGCYRTGTFHVGNDSLLSIELDSINADCRFDQLGGVALSVNGTPPYSYLWSNGATSPNLQNLSPGQYAVTVSDAAGCDAVGSVMVRDYGTFDWNLYLGRRCPVDTAPNKLIVSSYYLDERAVFPLMVSWSNGSRQLVHSLKEDTNLSQIVGEQADVPIGPYSVTVSDADGCSENRKVMMDCPVKDTIGNPGTRFFMKTPTSSAYVDGCLKVSGENVEELTELRFSLDWHPFYMDFKEIKTPYHWATGVTQDNFTVTGSRINFHWQKPDGPSMHLRDGWTIFEACFTPNNGFTDAPIEFTSGDAPPSVTHSTKGELGFIGKNARVYFEYDPDSEAICDFDLTLPDCASDGYARIQLENCYPDNYATHLTISFNGTVNYNTNNEKLLFAEPGEYKISKSSNGGSSSLFAYVPSYSPAPPNCVWPGDTDDNGTVNHHDLLYLGLGMGSQGEPRTDSAVAWQGADATDWPQITPARHVNFKNIDADGNGLIDLADTASVTLHWGKSVNYFRTNPYTLSGVADEGNNDASLSFLADTLNTGELLEIPVILGSTAAPVSDALGLSFSVSYDPKLVASAVRFEPVNSWLGNPAANLIFLQKDFQDQNRLDVALTRTDGIASDGEGQIGKLILIFKALPPDSLLSTTLFVSNALAITPDERLIALRERQTDFVIRQKASVSIADLSVLEKSITLAPNPARSFVRVESPAASIRRMEIADATGKVVSKLEINDANEASVAIGTLSNGIYFARIFTETGTVVKKVSVAR